MVGSLINAHEAAEWGGWPTMAPFPSSKQHASHVIEVPVSAPRPYQTWKNKITHATARAPCKLNSPRRPWLHMYSTVYTVSQGSATTVYQTMSTTRLADC